MFPDRQRILMAVTGRTGPAATRPYVMHLLFLLTLEARRHLPPGFYKFLPLLHSQGDPPRYGPFSFQGYRELVSLDEEGYFLNDDRSFLEKNARFILRREWGRLPRETRDAVSALLQRCQGRTIEQLRDEIRERAPWYVTGGATDGAGQDALWTVGYQDRSVDAVLAALMRRGVRRLLDVRHLPSSRRYGFDGWELQRLCAMVDIDYVHLPALGVRREPRGRAEGCGRLNGGRPVPPLQAEALEQAVGLVREAPSALLCAEADPAECRRGRLGPTLAEQAGLGISHL